MEKVKRFLKENWILVLSFIYIISPIDLIPGDFATGVGLIDDIGVLFLTGIYSFVKFLIIERRKENHS
jgi:uncharacterized membrane protein YkvA (DUF1232 family)